MSALEKYYALNRVIAGVRWLEKSYLNEKATCELRPWVTGVEPSSQRERHLAEALRQVLPDVFEKQSDGQWSWGGAKERKRSTCFRG